MCAQARIDAKQRALVQDKTTFARIFAKVQRSPQTVTDVGIHLPMMTR